MLTTYPEDRPSGFVIDARRWPGSKQLRRDLLQGIGALAGDNGRWRRSTTIKKNCDNARNFVTWLDRFDHPNLPRSAEKPQSLGELTPGIWAAYATDRKGKTKAALRTLLQVGVMLAHCPALPDNLSTLVRVRLGGIKAGAVEHYSLDEFDRIEAAARKAVTQAHRRLRPNLELASRYDDPELDEAERERAKALHETLMRGAPQTAAGFAALGARTQNLEVDSRTGRPCIRYKHNRAECQAMLFLTDAEAHACAVALVCARGLNMTTLLAAVAPSDDRGEGGNLLQLDLDKPRRGPGARFFPEIFEDNGPGSDGRLLATITELTEPLRLHRSAQGGSDLPLIGYWSFHGSAIGPHWGLPQWRQRQGSSWVPDDVTIDFKKLKRTYETRKARESTHNSEEVHVAVYSSGDPEFVEQQRRLAQAGIQAAADRARQELKMSFVTGEAISPAVANGSKDTVMGACVDVLHHPDTQEVCHDSFLMCLTCTNAVATPRHLPRLVAVLDALEELRSSCPGELWRQRFNPPFLRLRALLERRTPTELADARRQVKPADRVVVRQALTTRVT